jgi:hypothetical protein
VTGTALLAGVACFSTTTCLAVGSDSASAHGVLVPITNAALGTVQTVAAWCNPGGFGDVHPSGLGCSIADLCLAAGVDSSSVDAVVVPINSEIAGSVVPAATDVMADRIACAAPICVAVGDNISEVGVVFGVLPVTVSGSQVVGAQTPLFSAMTGPPAGNHFSGTLSCTTVGQPAQVISPSLALGTYLLNGSSCSGLTLVGTTAADFLLLYGDGSFQVTSVHGSTIFIDHYLLADPP